MYQIEVGTPQGNYTTSTFKQFTCLVSATTKLLWCRETFPHLKYRVVNA